MQPAPELDIALKPSPTLAVCLVLAHGIGVAAIWLSALDLGWHVALKLALALSLWWTLRQAGWFGNRRFIANIRIRPAGRQDAGDRVEAVRRDGTIVTGSIVEGNFVTPWLTMLSWRRDGARAWGLLETVPILPDSIDGAAFRRLRVRLKWGRAAPV